ncbi:MAG: hypothetical protein NZ772_01525 [Cyanobacteria bacterium]|nr:hypothetical protein [Cyanobacteriota bacterium]MDW8199793.1 hypothetical protein [Cyanobacteriota bacterium SKYGB_h_bin112]
MITQATTSPKTEKLVQRLTDGCAAIVNFADHSPVVAAAYATLQLLIPQLQRGKPILTIASHDPKLAETVITYVSHDRPWIEAYDLHQVIVPPGIQAIEELQPHWHCDVWCLVTDSADDWQWTLPPSTTYPNTRGEVVSPLSTEQVPATIVTLCQTLEALVKRKPEEVLLKRVTAQSLLQLDAVIAALATEHQQLAATIASTQSALAQVAQSTDLTNVIQAEQTLRTLQQHLDPTFKELEVSLEPAKETLLDPYYRYSLVHQIQAFTDALHPVVIRRGSSQYIQLEAGHLHRSLDINLDLVQLCDNRLAQWALEQWQRLYAGGIDQLTQRIDLAIHRIPGDRSDRPTFTPTIQHLTFQRLMKDSIAGISCELYYKEVSIWHHIMRQLRSQWMGLMFLFTFISMIGLSSSNKRSLIQGMLAPLYQLTDRPWLLIMVLSLIFCPLFLWLFSGHHAESQIKLEDGAAKLRKQLFDYYRKFAEMSLDRMLKLLKEALAQEKEQMQHQMQWAMDYLTAYKADVQQEQHTLQQQLQELENRQKMLTNVQTEVKKQRSRLV